MRVCILQVISRTWACGNCNIVKRLGQHIVDLGVVVVDEDLPDATGIQLLSRIRTLRPDVERVLLASDADREELLGALNAGLVLRFVAKPLRTRELLDAVDAGLAAAQLRRDERRCRIMARRRGRQLRALERRVEETVREKTHALAAASRMASLSIP